MDGVGTPIIGRPRPLPGHDTPNPAYHPHTLNYEEPDNYSQTEVDRYISRSFTGKRKTVIKYSIKFDLVTAEGEAIHFEFEDTKDEPELYVPLVKFCKDKGTSAVLKRYPNTEIVEDFQVK